MEQHDNSNGTRREHDDGASVLVVGAGPVGLALAAELGRQGVACRLIDETRTRLDTSRAVSLYARTLEVFEDLGIVDEAIAIGRAVGGVSVWARNGSTSGHAKCLVDLGFEDLDSPYPLILALPQSETDRMLEAAAARGGVSVERRVRLQDLAADADGVTVQLEHLDDAHLETSRFGWVIGCDGASSRVRNSLAAIHFTGAPEAEVAIADVEMSWDHSAHEAHLFLSPDGALMFTPLPGERRWRLAAELPLSPDHALRAPPSLRDLQALTRERGATAATIHAALWTSMLLVRPRIASRFGVGRVLLAGEAAHVHSPMAGQGINLGIQDAHNLAWKLSVVIRHSAPHALLESYDLERRPVAASVLRDSRIVGHFLHARAHLATDVRDRMGAALLGLQAIQRRIARRVADLDSDYAGGPLAVEDRNGSSPVEGAEAVPLWARMAFGRGPAPGSRAPDVEFGATERRRRLHHLLRGGRHTMLVFAGSGARATRLRELDHLAAEVQTTYAGQVDSYLVLRRPRGELHERQGWTLIDPDGGLHARFAASAECLYLVRPDGHIAYRSQPVDVVRLRAFLGGLMVPRWESASGRRRRGSRRPRPDPTHPRPGQDPKRRRPAR